MIDNLNKNVLKYAGWSKKKQKHYSILMREMMFLFIQK